MHDPGLNFDLGETIDSLRDAIQHFAADEITPRAADIDRDNQFPADLWKKLGDLGLHGMTVSEEYGGTELGYLAHIVAMEEVSRASASVGLSYGAHSNLCVNQIHRNHVGEVAEVGAAILFGNRHAMQTQVAELLPQVSRKQVVVVDGRSARRDFGSGKTLHGIAQHRDGFAQVEAESGKMVHGGACGKVSGRFASKDSGGNGLSCGLGSL